MSLKCNFRRKYHKYGDFIIIKDFPNKRSIDSSFQSEKEFWTENTLYMNSDRKKFSKEILKNALLVTPLWSIIYGAHMV